MKLEESFYLRNDVVGVARDLVGKVLVTTIDGVVTKGRIVETEAYSYKERACHAYNGKRTKRTETLFAQGGTAYVYLCYGIHELFNIVTNEEGVAEAVLIRGLEPLEGVDEMLLRRNFSTLNYQLTSGPGKLSQALGISRRNNNKSLLHGAIWVEDDLYDSRQEVVNNPRIGVGYAGQDALLPWRFHYKDNPWVSKGVNRYQV